MRYNVFFDDWKIPKMLFLWFARHAPCYPDWHQGSWLKQFKQNIVYEGCHSDVLVCLSSPPPFELPVADFGKVAWGVRAVEPRCEFESGANYFALRFPPRGRAYYWAPIVYLFVCLRLCRLPFHWVHLFLSCSHVTGSLLNSLSISFWGARANNYYFVHTYTCTLFCLPKMTNRRCARTSLPPMRNKDVLGPASPHWVIEQHRIASTCLYELFE